MLSWFHAQADTSLLISVLTVGEIRRGILLVGQRDPAKAVALDRWLRRTIEMWSSRILPVGQRVAELWAELMTPSPRSEPAAARTSPSFSTSAARQRA